MASIIFIYNSTSTTIQCQKDEEFKDILQKFSNKIRIDLSELFFIYRGEMINPKLTFNQLAKEEDKIKNQMTILANSLDKATKYEKIKTESIDVICPKCGENCLLHIKDYKIQLSDCKNSHIINNISLEEYKDSQIIDESKIKCEICKEKNKASCFNNEFYKCLQCKKNMCPICKSSHNKDHEISEFSQLNYICVNHNEKFTSFCKSCKINLCIECESTHKDKENLIYFRDILPNKDKIKNQINDLNIKINKYKEIINNLKNLLDKIVLNLEIFNKINDNLMKNYEKKRRNFHLLKNINELEQNNINVLSDLNKIINENNPINLFNFSINMMNKINIKFNGKSVPGLYENKNNEIKCQKDNEYEFYEKEKYDYNKFIYLSFLAEECKLYKDMKYFIEKVIKNKGYLLTSDERNLFLVTCQKYISDYRSAIITIENNKNKEEKKESSKFLPYIIEYKKFIGNEMYKLCQGIIKIIDDNFMKEDCFKKLDVESKIFYLKMKGDFNRYLAENEINKEKTIDETRKYYNEGLKISQNLPFHNYLKLGLYLNYSIFYKDILNDNEKAIEMSKSAIKNFEEVKNKLDENDEKVKDSFSVYELIKENLSEWEKEK